MVLRGRQLGHPRRRKVEGGHLKSVPGARPHGVLAWLALATLVLAVSLIRIPYLALTPGLAQNVAELIVVDGVETTPVRGKLLLTTVALHPIQVHDAVRGWIDPSVSIVSRSVIIPSGESEEVVQRRTTRQMDESQLKAAAAALELLGYDVAVEGAGARIEAVARDAPAVHVLRRGDVILEADGRPIRRPEDLVAQVQSRAVGQEIRLQLDRDGERLDVTVRTVARPADPTVPVIGVSIVEVPAVKLPLAVRIDSRGIGGPSAGLMFAVGIVDLLDQRDLARGRVLAGTGEIDLDGKVGRVGGIRQKVESARRAGAEIFLVPMDEMREACALGDGMVIAGVDTLTDAVALLEAGEIGAERTCPR